jgi:small subunit ribosomal protein S23
MKAESLPAAKAYDTARKELYRFRHYREVQQRVAREEALAQGAYFGPGPLQIGMQIEDKMYENWKEWAVKEITAAKALAGSAYTGVEQDSGTVLGGGEESEVLQEVTESVPEAGKGPAALGGVAMHP